MASSIVGSADDSGDANVETEELVEEKVFVKWLELSGMRIVK